MEILKQALRKTGLYFITMGTVSLVLLGMFLFNVLSWYHNQGFTDKTWLLILPVTGIFALCSVVLFFSFGLPYLISGKNSFLKIIEGNPQSITDIYSFSQPILTRNGVNYFYHNRPRFFKIVIKLTDGKEDKILLRPNFFKPVLNYIISVAPQAKVH